MPETLLQSLERYASQHQLRIGEKLGSGIHGLVHEAIRQDGVERSALKVHHAVDANVSEREAYRRLRAASVEQIESLNVPQLIEWDDKLLIVQMTIVSKPFLLDFAGVTIDHRPDFPEDVWREWEEGKREQFGNRWLAVQRIISELETFGIYLNDVSPSNIAFE